MKRGEIQSQHQACSLKERGRCLEAIIEPAGTGRPDDRFPPLDQSRKIAPVDAEVTIFAYRAR